VITVDLMTNEMKEIRRLNTRWFRQNAVVTSHPSGLVSDQDLIGRAHAAYARASDASADQPAAALTEVRTIQGRRYVVVQNAYRELARYRVRNDGGLRRVIELGPGSSVRSDVG
jgi:hypothetical protein